MVLAVFGLLGGWWRSWFLRRVKLSIHSLQLDIARLDLLRVEIKELQRLLESKQMFMLVITFQRLGDFILALSTTSLPVTGQYFRTALPSDNGPDDLHACDASDVRQHVGQLQIHELQRLLHMLNMCGSVPQEHVPMAHQAANAADMFRWSERSLEQAIGMQLLNPLTVHDVSLSSAHVLDVPGIDQIDLKPVTFQDFIQWDPVYPVASIATVSILHASNQ